MCGVDRSRRAPDRRARLAAALRTRIWQARLSLGLIVLVAAVIRVLGTGFGFPLLFHPDEWAVVDGAIDMARRNSFEPPWSLRPDHVEMKIDYVVFAGYAAVVKGMSIEAAFALDPVPFYWMARLVTATFGVATVLLAYLVGARWSRRVGLVAAVLFALFPPFVTHAHYATPDVPLTFAVLAMIYALMRYCVTCSWPSLLWACLAVALAVAIKYPGAVGTVMIGAVVVATAVRDRAWTRIVVHGAGAVGACMGFLFVISPSLFTDFSGIRRELKIQAAGDRLGHPDLGQFGNMWFYVQTYAEFAGLLLCLLALVGLAVVVSRRRLDVLPWFSGLLVWASLSTLPMTWERWGLPMWITPLLLASVGLCSLEERLRSVRTRWIPWAVAALVVVHLGAGSARAVGSLLAPDTRTIAVAYVERHRIEARDTLYEGYSPFLPGAPLLTFNQVALDGDGRGRDGYRVTTLEGRPARYVVLSSTMYDRVLADPAYREEAQFYDWLDQHGRERARFTPATDPPVTWFEPLSIARNLRFTGAIADGGKSGPTLVIYELPQSR